MSAIISPAPSPAASTAQIALSSSGSADAAATDTAGAGSFAALFQQLAGKQLSTNLRPDQTVLPTDTATAIENTETGDSLTALLPFLEAMGLMPVAAASTNPDKTEMSAEEIADASLLAGIAPALTPQLAPMANTAAISAVQLSAANNAQVPLPVDGVAQPHSDISSALITAGQEATLTVAEQGSLLTTEFSSRLAAAQETLGDKVANPLPAAAVAPQSAATLQSSLTAAPVLPVEHPVGTSGWGQEVGNRVVWMANRMESRAELVLNPPQMGRVEVSLSISGDQATASFVSANPTVREALEAAMPRLREILADAGIQLGQAQVGAENPHQSAQQEKNGDNFGLDRAAQSAEGPQQASTTAPPLSPGLKIGRGLVDVFA